MIRAPLISLLLGCLLAFAVRAQAPAAAPAAAQEPDPKIVVGLMECLAEGLPEGWKKSWFVIQEIRRSLDGTRQYEARFLYSTNPADRAGKPFQACGATRIIDGVLALNEYLLPSQRRWTGMTMTFNIDGSYDAAYDYTERAPAAAEAPATKAAPKPVAKKKRDAAK